MVKTATSQKKKWQNLTDARKLRHIENTLDKAIAAIQEEGDVYSLEDFKNFVEKYSRRSGKAAVAVELCTEPGSDEIKGFRFYLTKDPTQRTSGKYLIKNLGDDTSKDEDYFTPSNIMNLLGIEAEDADELDLDEEDEDLDLDEEDEDLLDEEETTKRRPTSKQFHNGSKQQPTSRAAKRTAQPQMTEAEEEDVDPEDLLSDDEVQSAKPKNQSKAAARTQPKPQHTNHQTEPKPNNQKPGFEKDLADNLTEEVSRLSSNAATKGSELSGINLGGLTGQLGMLGIEVGGQSASAIALFLEQLKHQNEAERVEDILKDLEEKNARAGKIFKRLQKIVKNTPAEELPEELTHAAEVFQPSQPVEVADNPIADAAASVGSKIDKLGSQLDPKYKSEPLQLDKNAPISEQLDQIEKYLHKLDQRLNRLEAIVNELEEKLSPKVQNQHSPTEATVSENAKSATKLAVQKVASPPTELKVSRQKQPVVNNSISALEPEDLESNDEELDSDEEELLTTQEKFAANGSLENDEEDLLITQKKLPANASLTTDEEELLTTQKKLPANASLTTDGEELLSAQKKSTANESLENDESDDILEQIVVKRKLQQQQVACAESLVNFAAVTAQLTQQSPQEGIPLTGGSTLYLESQDNQLSFTLKSNNEKEIFAGTNKDGKWAVHTDQLNSDEKGNILNLPQSAEEYAIKASAQALVEKFQETFPKRFSGEKEPTFTWKENKQPKYEFEILALKGSKVLQGFDPHQDDKQVFEAVLVDNQPPDIKKCHIPIAEMESLLGEPEATQTAKPSTSRNPRLEIQEQQKQDKEQLEM